VEWENLSVYLPVSAEYHIYFAMTMTLMDELRMTLEKPVLPKNSRNQPKQEVCQIWKHLLLHD
jgi:hypothetical protein